MILAVIQARMSSVRLPGKVLMPIFGVPMLLWMHDRVKQARKIDTLVIATSMDKTDEPIRQLCRDNKILCFSGSLNDVLDRFYWLAQIFCPEHIVRLTGDCPMIQSEIIDNTIDCHVTGKHDYTRARGFPDGLDVEVVSFDALCKAWKDSITPYDREHVLPYIYQTAQNGFKIGYYDSNVDRSKTKISVDTQEDYAKLIRMLEIAICQNSTFLIRNLY